VKKEDGSWALHPSLVSFCVLGRLLCAAVVCMKPFESLIMGDVYNKVPSQCANGPVVPW
jgi:hypothetical protein